MKIEFVNLYDFSIPRKLETPIGIQSLYLFLRKNSDYEVGICDFNKLYYNGKLLDLGLETNIKEMANHIINQRPDIISIYTMCNNYFIAILLAKELKSRMETIKIIFAGPQATLVAEETLEKFPFVDYIAMGEGEHTILGILEGISEDNLCNVEGLCYREKGRIVNTWDRKSFCDINSLDMIDPHKINESSNFNNKKKALDIEVGRGCPFSCTYCSTRLFWGNKYRVKKVSKIIDELDYYINNYEIYDFSFQHDLFTLREDYILEFCNELLDRNFDITWGCSSRVDTLSQKMIDHMSKAGCYKIFFGIESGSARIQKMINKNLKLEKIEEISTMVLNAGLEAIYSFIYGFPGETEEDLNQTLLLMYKLKKKDTTNNTNNIELQLWPINFLPGTKLTSNNRDTLIYNDFLKSDFSYSKYLNDDKVISLIKENKNIFINYYDLPENKNSEYRSLNSTMMILLNKTYPYIKLSLDNIIESYDKNMVKFYKELYYYSDEKVTELCFFNIIKNNMSTKEQIWMMIKFLEMLLLKSKVFINKENIYEIFKFEKDIFEFLYKSDKNSITKSYNYNVIEIKNEKSLANVKKEKTNILFAKNSNNIIVKII